MVATGTRRLSHRDDVGGIRLCSLPRIPIHANDSIGSVVAIFENNLDAPQRVQVLVQLLGRPLLVELDAAIVRAAS